MGVLLKAEESLTRVKIVKLAPNRATLRQKKLSKETAATKQY